MTRPRVVNLVTHLIMYYYVNKSTCSNDTLTAQGGEAPTFLTVAEVAEIMRVSKMTVYRMVHSGELPAARFGRSFRVDSRVVDDYLKSSFYEVG